jgi:hypothetical protein
MVDRAMEQGIMAMEAAQQEISILERVTAQAPL